MSDCISWDQVAVMEISNPVEDRHFPRHEECSWDIFSVQEQKLMQSVEPRQFDCSGEEKLVQVLGLAVS